MKQGPSAFGVEVEVPLQLVSDLPALAWTRPCIIFRNVLVLSQNYTNHIASSALACRNLEVMASVLQMLAEFPKVCDPHIFLLANLC